MGIVCKLASETWASTESDTWPRGSWGSGLGWSWGSGWSWIWWSVDGNSSNNSIDSIKRWKFKFNTADISGITSSAGEIRNINEEESIRIIVFTTSTFNTGNR